MTRDKQPQWECWASVFGSAGLRCVMAAGGGGGEVLSCAAYHHNNYPTG